MNNLPDNAPVFLMAILDVLFETCKEATPDLSRQHAQDTVYPVFGIIVGAITRYGMSKQDIFYCVAPNVIKDYDNDPSNYLNKHFPKK